MNFQTKKAEEIAKLLAWGRSYQNKCEQCD